MAPIIMAHHKIVAHAMIDSISLLCVEALVPALISFNIMDIKRFRELSHIEWKPPSLIVPACENPQDSHSVENVDMMKWFNKDIVYESDGRTFEVR